MIPALGHLGNAAILHSLKMLPLLLPNVKPPEGWCIHLFNGLGLLLFAGNWERFKVKTQLPGPACDLLQAAGRHWCCRSHYKVRVGGDREAQGQSLSLPCCLPGTNPRSLPSPSTRGHPCTLLEPSHSTVPSHQHVDLGLDPPLYWIMEEGRRGVEDRKWALGSCELETI